MAITAVGLFGFVSCSWKLELLWFEGIWGHSSQVFAKFC